MTAGIINRHRRLSNLPAAFEIVERFVEAADKGGDLFTRLSLLFNRIKMIKWEGQAREEIHAVLLMDRAGWHTTGELKLPENITPVLLPPRSPELNPTENVWQYLRQTYLSNRVFDSYDAIIDAACDAWNQLIDKPWKIMSIGMREWAHSGQTQ